MTKMAVFNTSSWQPNGNSSTMEELAQPSNPYSKRTVGVTSKVQTEMERRVPWLGKKCASKCGLGFNSLSQMVQCKGCDSFYSYEGKMYK